MPSTVIRNYLYDAANGELWITFVTGRRYVYAAVPQFSTRSRRRLHAARSSIAKSATAMRIARSRAVKVIQAVTESDAAEEAEIAWAWR